MSSTQDVRFAQGTIEEGAALANKLWNAARFVLLKVDPRTRGRRRPPRSRSTAGSCRGSRPRSTTVTARLRRVPVLERRQDALRLPLERRLRLVPRGAQAPPLRRRPRGAAAGVGDGAVRPRAHARAAAPADAVRDRGDLGVPARSRRAADARAARPTRRRLPRDAEARAPGRRRRRRHHRACGGCARTPGSGRASRSRSPCPPAPTATRCARRPTCCAASGTPRSTAPTCPSACRSPPATRRWPCAATGSPAGCASGCASASRTPRRSATRRRRSWPTRASWSAHRRPS